MNFSVFKVDGTCRMFLTILVMCFGCLTMSAQSQSHLYDFSSWSAATISDLGAVALPNSDANITSDTPWSTSEKASGTSDNDGHGYYNHAALTDVTLAANGNVISETSQLSITAPSHGLGIINDLKTALATYQGESYLWLMGANTYIVASNIACGATLKLGIESHKDTEARGVVVSYKDNGTWKEIGTYTTTTYAEKEIAIPLVAGQSVTDIKIQATKGMHLYYIDAVLPGMSLQTTSKSLVAGASYSLVSGTDYTNVSGATISFSSGDESVATVDANGVITAVGVGETTITLSQAASGDYSASTRTITVIVVGTNVKPTFTKDLNATYGVVQGRTASLKVEVANGDSYQWYTCADIDGETEKTPIEGATSSAYNIPDDWANGTYYIYCLATNSENGESTRSQVATVEIGPLTHTFDFTSYSNATVNNLMAGVYGTTQETNPVSGWSDVESLAKIETSYDPASGWPSKENCFWQVAHETGTLHANGAEIPELKGLSFTNTNDRGLAIALDYQTANASATNFGPYKGESYLWLGSKNIEYFTIPNVKVGSVIKMGVETHKLGTNRGVSLTNKATSTVLNDPEGNAVAYPTEYADQEWLVEGTGQTADISVKNNDGTHIYYIDAEIVGFKMLRDSMLLAVGDEYSILENTDYANISGVEVKAVESSNPSVVAVDENGKLTALATGSAIISIRQEGTGIYSDAILTLKVNVKKLYSVNYTKGTDGAVKGTALGTVRYDENATISLPSPNNLLYKEGYTMTGWNDGTATYDLGADYTVTADVDMTPVFTANGEGKTLNTLTAPTTVTWNFGRTQGAPAVEWTSAAATQPNYLVAQAEVNGETQDVALKINTEAAGSKFSNISRADNSDAQLNDNTVFIIPAAQHMQVTINNVYGTSPVATVSAAGAESEQMIFNSTAKTLTYTYDGDASEISISIDGVGYADGITVKYPCASDLVRVEGVESFTLKEGETHTLTKGTDFTTSSNGALTYTSSNTNAVEVNANGVIRAVGAGEAVITVTQAATTNYSMGAVTYTVKASAATEAVVITKNLDAETTAQVKADNVLEIVAENASSYQWYMCDDASKTNAVAIEGATESTYSFRPATTGEFYIYCVAGNSLGSVTSNVTCVTVGRKLQWNFVQTAEQAAAVQNSIDNGAGYWTTSSNGRFVTSHVYNDSQVMLDANTPLPVMEGLFVTGTSSNQLLVGSPVNSTYNRLQLNASYTITIPDCKAGDEINIVCVQSTNSGTRKLSVEGSYSDQGLGDNHDYIENTEHKSTFKFTMLQDGDCNIQAERYAIYSINIMDENYVKERFVYSVVAVDSLSGETLDYVMPVTSAWEGDVIAGVPYSYWKRTSDDRLVRCASQNKNFHMNYEVTRDTTFTILYKPTGIDKVVYLSEAENITGLTACKGSTVEPRASLAGAAYNGSNTNVKITSLIPGRYAIRVGILDAVNGGSQKLTLLAGTDSVKFSTPARSSGEVNNFTELEEIITVDEYTNLYVPKNSGHDNLGYDIIAVYDVSLPKADTPVINVDNDAATFTITPGDEEDDVYYTIDGTTPSSTNGEYYEGNTVHLPTNCTIRAIALHSQKTASDIATETTKFVTYKINATALPVLYGNVQMTPVSKDNTYTVGTEVTLRAIAKSGYGFVGWTTTSDGTVEDDMKESKIVITMPENDVRLFANFAQGKNGTVRYDLTATKWYDADGEAMTDVSEKYTEISGASDFPTEIECSSVNVPSNYSLYMQDYTLIYWEDENGNKYNCGENKLFTDNFTSVTLHPVYQQNVEEDLLNIRTAPVEVTWDFRTGYGAQQMAVEDTDKTLCYVTHAVVSGPKSTDQTIDVAAWINTNSSTFSNDDIDTWAYMSSGTKITVPSGDGTKITLATYSRITDEAGGTRVNGKLPDNIYDEELVKNVDGQYLYTWTIEDENPTAELTIGSKDYSYYAYMTVHLKSAAMQTLSVETSNSAMGTVKIVTEGGTKVSGGRSFINGTYVDVAAMRNRFFELDYWLDGDGNKIYPDNHWVDADNVSHNTELDEEFKIGNITYTKVSQDTIKFQLAARLSLKAVFKDKKSYYIDFSTGGQAAGLPPLQQHIEEGESFVMPVCNNRLYLEGYTLVDYVDADGNHYKFTKSYKPTSDLLLTPNFKKNTLSLGDIVEPTTVKWPLNTGDNAPDLYYNKSQGLTVNQLKFANDSIDMPLYIDGNAGALSNLDNSAYCVASAGCVLTMPTSKNCVISINSINGAFQNTLIAGASYVRGTSYSSAYGLVSTPVVTYTGDAATQEIQMKETRRCTYVSVTYQPIDKPILTGVKYGDTELSSAQLETLKTTGELTGISCPASYDSEELIKVSATVTNGTADIVNPTAENPVAQITLKTPGGVVTELYTITFNVTGKVAPVAQSATVSGNAASLNGSATVSGVGENGVIAITFDHYMTDAALDATTGLGQALTGKADGKTLKFTYWNLQAGHTYTLTIPAGALKDAYGVATTNNLTVKFQPQARTLAQSKLFNFVVTHKQDWDCETQTAGTRIQVVSDDVIKNLKELNISYGTIDEATEAANAASASERYYIFVPDGEYCMKGNTKGILAAGTYNDTKLGSNQGYTVPANYYNGRTYINRDYVSLIGQSQNGTVLYNNPYVYGISYTSTLEVRSKKKDCYFQDLTVDNRFSKYQVDRGDANPSGQAVAVYDRGIHSIWKNVTMKGYQDTYASASNSSGFNVDKGQVTPGCFHTYRYYEDCQVWGTVDFLCGGGDDWWEKPTFVLRKRATANNIVAPRHWHPSVTQYCTGADSLFTEKWGYVFNNAKIVAESDAAYGVQNGKFTLGRPWAYSPTCTYLNADFAVKPADVGWSNMSGTLVIRMHEYGSTLNGVKLDLTQRTLRASTPAAGSDDCILTAEQAAEYTMHNVLGGDDAYDPTIYTEQVSMENCGLVNSTNDVGSSVLTWTGSEKALCYFVFRLDEETGDTIFYSMTVDNSFLPDESQAGRWFVIRAANERGGLGAPSKAIQYLPLDVYEVEVKQVGSNPEMGWATVCLPQNTTFDDVEKFTVYAAISCDGKTLSMVKVERSKGMSAGKGYVIYAKPGKYYFRGTYNSPSAISGNVYSILGGNPEDHAVSVGTLDIYTLSYKESISTEVGFYKFVGAEIPARKAYLESSLVGNSSGGIYIDGNNAKSTGMRFFDSIEEYEEWATSIKGVEENDGEDTDDGAVYDLSGKRIEESQLRDGQIYIIQGQKKVYSR